MRKRGRVYFILSSFCWQCSLAQRGGFKFFLRREREKCYSDLTWRYNHTWWDERFYIFAFIEYLIYPSPKLINVRSKSASTCMIVTTQSQTSLHWSQNVFMTTVRNSKLVKNFLWSLKMFRDDQSLDSSYTFHDLSLIHISEPTRPY